MRRLIPPLVVLIIRTIAVTLRIRIDDRCGVTRGELPEPIIWAAWHNRILVMAITYAKYFSHRRCSVLTSASKDGAIVAEVMARFGTGSVRGSSSRRGGVALREMAGIVESGSDVVITPDGPRGPVYKLSPGVVKLAELTGAPVVPVHVHYSSYWQLRSWDGFRIPKFFSRVTVVLDVPIRLDAIISGDAFETERARLESILVTGSEPVSAGAL